MVEMWESDRIHSGDCTDLDSMHSSHVAQSVQLAPKVRRHPPFTGLLLNCAVSGGGGGGAVTEKESVLSISVCLES